MKGGSWGHMRTSTAYNKKEFTGLSQYGGVALISFDQLAHRTCGTGADERGLGRWAWMLFRGKNNIVTRIISAYQPNSGKYNQYFGSAYRQQERHFLSNDIDDDPITMFRNDLCVAIKNMD